MKSNYTTFGSVASAELELLAKREDNGKELRCEASNPALEGTLIETTTIKIECKCCCCHLPLTCLSSCFFVFFCCASLLFICCWRRWHRLVVLSLCLSYVFVWMCLRVCTDLLGCSLSTVCWTKFNQPLYKRSRKRAPRKQEPDVRALLEKLSLPFVSRPLVSFTLSYLSSTLLRHFPTSYIVQTRRTNPRYPLLGNSFSSHLSPFLSSFCFGVVTFFFFFLVSLLKF